MIPADLDWPSLVTRLTSPALHGLIAMMLLADESGTVRTSLTKLGQNLGPGGASRACVYRTIDALAAAGLATQPARTGRGIELRLTVPRSAPHHSSSDYILSDPARAPDASNLRTREHPAPTAGPARALINERSQRADSHHQDHAERSKTSAPSAQKRLLTPVLRAEIPGISRSNPEINTAAAAPIGNNGYSGEAAAASRNEAEQNADQDAAQISEIIGRDTFGQLTDAQLADLILDNRQAGAVAAALINAEFPTVADRDKLAAVLPSHAVIAAVRRADQVQKSGGFKTSRRAFLLALLDGKKTSREFVAECIADKRSAYQTRLSAHTREAARTEQALAALERARTDQAQRERSRTEAARLAHDLGPEKTAEVLGELAREDRALDRAIMARTREGRKPAEIAAGIAVREAFVTRVRTIQNGTRRTVPD